MKKYSFPAIYFEGTRVCNLKCKICMTGSNDARLVKKRIRDQLSAHEIKKHILEPGKELGASQLGLSGGEFLLRKDALEILQDAIDLDYDAKIVTNGTLLDDELLTELKEIAGPKLVMAFGINSATSRDLNRETRDLGLDTVLEALERCKKHGITRHVVVNIGSYNKEDIAETLAWLTTNRLPFNRSPFVARNSGEAYFNDMAFSRDDMERYIHPALRGNMLGYVSFTPFFLSPEVHAEISGGKSWNQTIPQNPPIGCFVGTWLGISAEGDVSPCATLLDELPAGNVREKPLYEIIDESPIFKNILNRDNLKGRCGRCRYKYTCGGCRSIAFFHTGDYMAEDPTCFFEPEDETTVSEHEEETNRNTRRYARFIMNTGLYDP